MKVFGTIFFIFFYLAEGSAQTVYDNPYLQAQSDHQGLFEACRDLVGLQSVRIKKDHTKTQSELFNYYYKYIPSAKSQTVVVVLPGGPGGGSMEDSSYSHLFSNDIGQILIDPRGVDCNYFGKNDFDLNTITSTQTAMDIIEVIKKENLKDYIIYGHSYGTLLGTILTSLINKDLTIPQPKALVIEGVIGKHYTNGYQYYQDHVDIVNQLFDENPHVKKLFMDENNLPLGWNAVAWLEYLINIPPVGINPISHPFIESPWHKLLELEMYLAKGAEVPKDLMTYFKEWWGYDDGVTDVDVGQNLNGPFSSQDEDAYLDLNEFLTETILCHEIAPEIPWSYDSFLFVNGVLVQDRSSAPLSCGANALKFPYDSKNFPIQSNTIYIQGTHDGQTPLKGARYHYNENTAAKKVFLQVEGAGHMASFLELNGCLMDLFHVIESDPNLDFSNVVAKNGHCKSQTKMRNQQLPRRRQNTL